MCAVSMVTRDWTDRVPKTYPYVPSTPYIDSIKEILDQQDMSEISKLRKEVEELKKLIKAAKEYDDNTGQPDCEKEENVVLIKKLAKALGVDLEGLI